MADGRLTTRPGIGRRSTLTLLLGVVALLAGCSDVRSDDGLERITIGNETFNMEVAADFESREQGLMHRSEVPADGGMIFIFPDSALRSFWMAYCLVDIDIVYLDAQGRVTAMHRMKAQPPKREEESDIAYHARMRWPPYPSKYPAQFALEFRSGTLDRLDLKVEDKIPLDLPRLKAMAR
jgi:uncharacterized membrane protein (UPF0127 family)